ncbi:hypothetical protein Bca4012_016530 [Brassica carinata]
MVTSAELVSSKISEKDLECTYTIICSLVKNVSSPEEVLEMVKVIASKVVQQPNDKASLRLKILFNLYNLLDHPSARFQVYMKALELAVNGKVTDCIVPSFKKIDSFLKEWNIDMKDQRELFLAIANVLRENKSLTKESLQFATRYLATFSNEDTQVLSEAKEEAVRATIEFVKAPSIFRCDLLLDMPAVAQLEKDPNTAPVYQLLKIFLTQRLDAYMEFQNANSGFLQTYGLVEEDCVANLASDESGKIPYASIKSILQVDDEEVEFRVKTMANMPMDIVADVFLRLPATTLLRCRVLSKPCCSLLDSPDFIASHLKRTLETEEHLKILLQSHRRLRRLHFEGPDRFSDVDHPLRTGDYTKVFGSVNGLIGLTNSPLVLALFNPSTRTIHRLPIESVVSFKFVRPLIYSKDRSKILLEINSKRLMWFDLVAKSFETLEIKGCKGPRNAEILVSSLVLGCKSVSRRAPEKRMLQKGNKSWYAHLCSLVLGCRGDPREKEIMVKGNKKGRWVSVQGIQAQVMSKAWGTFKSKPSSRCRV